MIDNIKINKKLWYAFYANFNNLHALIKNIITKRHGI